MANIYNFGTNLLDLEDYIKALRVNVSTFLNEDPSTKKWTDEEKEKFKKVHELFIKDVSENPERFYTDDFGTFYDKQGKWEENDSTKKYIYYADKMAKGLLRNSKKEKEEEKKEEFVPEKFDAYFYRDNNVTNDPTKELEHITDKREYLKGYIDTYITYLKDHGLSTEKFDTLKEIINNSNSTRELLINAFNKAELDESFYTMFLPNLEDDKTIALKKLFEERSNTFNTAYPTIQNLYVGDAYDDLDDKDHDFITNDGILNIGGSSITDLMYDEEIDFDKLSKEEALILLKNKLLNNLLDKSDSSKYNSAVLLELLKMDKNVFETDEYIVLDPTTKNLNSDYLNTITSNNAVLVYNKRNRKFELRYMDNFPQFKNQISENWEFDKGYKKPANYRKEGGILYCYDGNKFKNPYEKYDGIKDYVNSSEKEKIEKRNKEIKESGKTAELLEYLEGNDVPYELIGSFALDLLSTGAAFFPGYGSAVSLVSGLASSGLEAYHDITKDGFQWLDLGNLGANIGMDFIGLFPGFGSTTKLGKITKVGRKIAPWFLNIFSTYNLSDGRVIDSFNKLINEEDLTTEDWENLYLGASTLLNYASWGASHFRKNKSKNKVNEIKIGGQSLSDVVSIPVKDRLGVKRAVIIGGQKASEVKLALNDNNIERVQQLVGEDYTVLTDQVSKLVNWWNPFKFEKKLVVNPFDHSLLDYNGKLFSRRKALFNNETTEGFILNANDLYKAVRSLVEAKEAALSKITKRNENKAESKQEIEAVRKSSEFGIKSKELQELDQVINKFENEPILQPLSEQQKLKVKELKEKRKELQLYFKKYGANATFKTSTKNLEEEIKTLQNELKSLEKYIHSNKQGGTLNILNVRKFQSGGTWRKNYILGKNPKNTNDWDNFYSDNIFDNFQIDVTSDEFLSGINELNSIDTSNLFKLKVLNLTGYKDWNQAYNKTGFNKLFGYSYDKSDYLGPTTWNRKTFLDLARVKYIQSNPLKTKDGSVYFNGVNWVKSDPNYSQKNYTLPYDIARKYGHIPTTEEFNNKTRGLTTLEQKNGFNPTEGLLDIEQVDESKINPWKHQTSNDNKNNFNRSWLFDPKFTHAIPRAMYADHVNKKLRDMAIANEKAFLKSPFEYTRYVTGDLGSLIQGVKQANELNSWASKTYVSDADKQKAYQLEAFNKGLDYVAAGYNSDNAARKASEEQVWLQSLQNAQNRYIAGLENILSLLKADSNRNLYRMGYENLKYTTWDTLAKQFEFDAINNYKEKIALQKLSDLSSVSSYINNNIIELASKQGYDVSQDAVDLYNNVRKGNIPESKLTPEEKESLNYVKDIVSNLRSIAIGKIYGYTPRYLSHYEYSPSYKFFKEGGSIKERIANVERLYKTIKSDLDRNEKRLDRLFKGLYKLKNK